MKISMIIMKIQDIGCGSGVLSIFLADRYRNSQIDALDIDDSAIQQTKKNIQLLSPSWQNRISVHQCEAQNFNESLNYDLIISNPPFFKSSKEKNRYVNTMKDNRRVARHQHSLEISDLIKGKKIH